MSSTSASPASGSRSPRTLATLVAAALLLGLAACGGSSEDGDAAWSYTDDIGTKIELDAVPERIIAHKDSAAALADMGLGDRVVGVFGAPDNPVADLGLQSPDLDLEKVAELRPDLIVTTTFGDGQLWYISDAIKAKLADTYDVAAINLEDETVDSVIENTERLGVALGAEESDFEEGHAALEAAGEKVKDVAAAAGDPSILVVAPSTDLLYVANTPAYSDLTYLKDEIGLDLVTPQESDLDDGGYWHSLSWEKADFYPDVDIAMWDTRGGETNLKTLQSQPVWERVKAAEDDAYLPWRNETAPSAQGYATLLEKLAADLTALKS